MRRARQCGTQRCMAIENVNAALSLIASKIPSLATQAAKQLARPNERLRAKAAATLAAKALGMPELGPDDRVTLLAAIAHDDTSADRERYTEVLPSVRVTPSMMQDIAAEAYRRGVPFADEIRRRLAR